MGHGADPSIPTEADPVFGAPSCWDIYPEVCRRTGRDGCQIGALVCGCGAACLRALDLCAGVDASLTDLCRKLHQHVNCAWQQKISLTPACSWWLGVCPGLLLANKRKRSRMLSSVWKHHGGPGGRRGGQRDGSLNRFAARLFGRWGGGDSQKGFDPGTVVWTVCDRDRSGAG